MRPYVVYPPLFCLSCTCCRALWQGQPCGSLSHSTRPPPGAVVARLDLVTVTCVTDLPQGEQYAAQGPRSPLLPYSPRVMVVLLVTVVVVVVVSPPGLPPPPQQPRRPVVVNPYAVPIPCSKR